MEEKLLVVRVLTIILVSSIILIPFTFVYAEGETRNTGDSVKNQIDIEVMSYNLYTTEKEPLTSTNKEGTKTRGEMLIELIGSYQPDSIGLNEVTEVWKKYLEEDVITYKYLNSTDYGIAGLESNNGIPLKSGSNEYSPILYRKDKYIVVDQGGYWLSESPDCPSKYGDIKDSNDNVLYSGMKFNRVFSYAVFENIDSEEIAYIHVNTHYDHQSSDYINEICSKQIKVKADELFDKYNVPIIITGDFNSTEQTNAYEYFAKGKNGYINSKYMTDDYSELSTCAGYGENYNELATGVIDHIFISDRNIGVYKHDVVVNPYLSDHSAVYAKFAINNQPIIEELSLDKEKIDNFSPTSYFYTVIADDDSLDIEIKSKDDYTVYVDGSLIKGNGSNRKTTIDLDDGDNVINVMVKTSAGISSVYVLNIYKSYGESIPIISEIYPNAKDGYRYFEVTNMGTKSFNTKDYCYLWGNIKDEDLRTWEGVFEPLDDNQHVVVRPGETVVFWFTYGGRFDGDIPTVDEFNREYGTNLHDSQIVISNPNEKIKGYLDGEVIHEFTFGANNLRGMRIASARDSDGRPYPWRELHTNTSYDGPTISISSYHGASSQDIPENKLFKFKYVEDEILTNRSDLLDKSKATPGFYDTRLGNEKKDGFARIEAEEFDAYSVLKAEEKNIGNTKAGSWAYYSNVDFGDKGAKSAIFYGSVKGSNASGIVEIYIEGTSDGDLSEAELIGSCEVTPTAPDDWNNYEEFYCELNQRVIGVHDIILKFIPSKTYVMNLDYFIFDPYKEGKDIEEITDFTFYIDGEEIADNVKETVNGYNTEKHIEVNLLYEPSDANIDIIWKSDNTDVARINTQTGEINVVGSGDTKFIAEIYSNSRLFETLTTPTITYDYRIDAFNRIEAEWVSQFTEGIDINGQVSSANLQYKVGATGMSDHVSDGYNLIGHTVNGSTARYNDIDFGDGNLGKVIFNMALKTGRCVGDVEIYLISEDGSLSNKIGYVRIADDDATDGGNGHYNTYREFDGIIMDSTIQGVNDIILKFVTDVHYVGNIDYFYFTKAANGEDIEDGDIEDGDIEDEGTEDKDLEDEDPVDDHSEDPDKKLILDSNSNEGKGDKGGSPKMGDTLPIVAILSGVVSFLAGIFIVRGKKKAL